MSDSHSKVMILIYSEHCEQLCVWGGRVSIKNAQIDERVKMKSYQGDRGNQFHP